MNSNPPRSKTVVIYAVAILGSLGIMAGMVGLMWHYTKVEPLGADRVTERKKNFAELKNANASTLSSLGWQDPVRGVVRLPIDRAMELTVKEWQNPAAARAALLSRLEKAMVPIAPPPPAPSKFE